MRWPTVHRRSLSLTTILAEAWSRHRVTLQLPPSSKLQGQF